VFAVFCAPYIVMMLFVNAIDFFFHKFFSELFLAFFFVYFMGGEKADDQEGSFGFPFFNVLFTIFCFVSAFVYFDGWWLLFAIKEFDLIVFV
jgi:hypothetical protein